MKSLETLFFSCKIVFVSDSPMTNIVEPDEAEVEEENSVHADDGEDVLHAGFLLPFVGESNDQHQHHVEYCAGQNDDRSVGELQGRHHAL